MMRVVDTCVRTYYALSRRTELRIEADWAGCQIKEALIFRLKDVNDLNTVLPWRAVLEPTLSVPSR